MANQPYPFYLAKDLLALYVCIFTGCPEENRDSPRMIYSSKLCLKYQEFVLL